MVLIMIRCLKPYSWGLISANPLTYTKKWFYNINVNINKKRIQRCANRLAYNKNMRWYKWQEEEGNCYL